GRAKTRAWVIFQECWRGPHAATGDRSRSATSLRPTQGNGRFMGSPLSFFRMHWDHEPDNAVGAGLCEPQHAGILKTHGLSRKRSGWRSCCGSQTRAPGPQVHGKPPFVFLARMGPIRFGPRAVPARSGRAKTRAWVISQGCWRGPHAATGDRSRSALRTGNSRATAGSWREPSFVFSAWIGTMNLTTRWERGSEPQHAATT